MIVIQNNIFKFEIKDQQISRKFNDTLISFMENMDWMYKSIECIIESENLTDDEKCNRLDDLFSINSVSIPKFTDQFRNTVKLKKIGYQFNERTILRNKS